MNADQGSQSDKMVPRPWTHDKRLEVERLRLQLRSRLAAAYKDYSGAVETSSWCREQMLPKARLAYDVYLASFRQMAATYPQVRIAQRNSLSVAAQAATGAY